MPVRFMQMSGIWEKTDWNCLLRILAFSLFREEVVFVLGSLRAETPCVSCLAFFIRENSLFEIDPDFFDNYHPLPLSNRVYFGCSCYKLL